VGRVGGRRARRRRRERYWWRKRSGRGDIGGKEGEGRG